MQKILKLSIQYFAEPKDDDTVPQTPPADPPKEAPKNDNLPKTQEELDALIEKRIARERKNLSRQSPPLAPAPQVPQEAQPAPAAPDPALLEAKHSLLEANAKLAAIQEGVNPSIVDDAVLLAIHEAEKDGKEGTDEKAIAEALKAVLVRHPEWKQEDRKGGFRVGAANQQNPPAGDDGLSAIFGNQS